MQATETLTDSSASSSNTSSSNSDSSNSSAESDAENSDFEETEHKNLLAQTKIGQSVDLLPKDPVREAKKYNQRYNLLMERINAINQDNEHLVSRILEVRTLCRIGRRHRAAIMKRLDSYGDNYKNIPVTIQLDKESNSSQSQLSTVTSTPSAIAGLNDVLVSNTPLAMSSPLLKKYKKKMKRQPSVEDSDQSDARKSGSSRGMPKRPHNAFFYFSQQKRPRMQKDFPNLSKKEIAGILSTKWSQITTEEKLPYLKMEEERRKDYRQALQRYKESLPPSEQDL